MCPHCHCLETHWKQMCEYQTGLILEQLQVEKQKQWKEMQTQQRIHIQHQQELLFQMKHHMDETKREILQQNKDINEHFRCLSVDPHMHQKYELVPYGTSSQYFYRRKEIQFILEHELCPNQLILLSFFNQILDFFQESYPIYGSSDKEDWFIEISDFDLLINDLIECSNLPLHLIHRCILLLVHHNYYSEYKQISTIQLLQQKIKYRKNVQHILSYYPMYANINQQFHTTLKHYLNTWSDKHVFWNTLVRLKAILLMTNDQLQKKYIYTPFSILRYTHDQRFQKENHPLAIPNRKVFLDSFEIQKTFVQCDCCQMSIPKSDIEKGHIVPKRMGGSYAIHNLLLLCKQCNSEIGSLDPYLYQRFIPKDNFKSIISMT